MKKKHMQGCGKNVVVRQGWGILHPDGFLELDHFYNPEISMTWTGDRTTAFQWMKMYRSDCTLHEIAITVILQDKKEKR